MLWRFFQQALASPHLNVDTAFREMLHLSRSWPGCRPVAEMPEAPASLFVDEPIEVAAAAAVLAPRDGVSLRQKRLADIKRGQTLKEVAGKNCKSSLAQYKRSIKMVGAACANTHALTTSYPLLGLPLYLRRPHAHHQEYGRLIWHILREAERAGWTSSVLDRQEVLEYRRLIRFLCNKPTPKTPKDTKTKALMLTDFHLEDHLVELRQNDRVMALPAASAASCALQEARIAHVQPDPVSGARTYTLAFANGHRRQGVSRRHIHTLGLQTGDVVLAKPQRDRAWTNARIEVVHRHADTGTCTYDIVFPSGGSSSPLRLHSVSIKHLRTPIPIHNIEFRSPTDGLGVGAAVLAQRVHGGGWEIACVQVVHADSTGTVQMYDVEFESDKSTRYGVSARGLRVQTHTVSVEHRTPHGSRIPISGSGSSTALPRKLRPLMDSHAVASYRAGGVSTVLLMCTYLKPGGDGIGVKMACGGVWDKEEAVVVAPQHLIPDGVTERTIIICYRDPSSEDHLRACVAEILDQDRSLDMLLLQAPAGTALGAALPLRESPVKAGENVWVMGWANIPGQSNGASLQRMPASVVSIDPETSELRLYMSAFEGLSGATVSDEAGYKVGQVLFKSDVPGYCFAANFTEGTWRDCLLRATRQHLHKRGFHELSTDAAVAAPHACTTLPSWLGLEPVPVGIRRRLPDGQGFLGDAIHRNFFDAGGTRLALVGAAGTGKSTALANYLHSHRSQYASVVFVNAENAIVLADSFQRVALGLGLDWASVLKRHGEAHVAASAILDQVREGP